MMLMKRRSCQEAPSGCFYDSESSLAARNFCVTSPRGARLARVPDYDLRRAAGASDRCGLTSFPRINPTRPRRFFANANAGSC